MKGDEDYPHIILHLSQADSPRGVATSRDKTPSATSEASLHKNSTLAPDYTSILPSHAQQLESVRPRTL